MAGCGTCGGRSAAAKWQWTSADGKQIVRGLSQTEAQMRQTRLGGSARAQ